MNKNIYTEYIIDELKSNLTNSSYRTAKMPVFLFLCGKELEEDSSQKFSNRQLVKEFYKNIDGQNVFCLFAESLWDNQINENLDLLTFEDFLAELSDYIILFIESFGTAAELGAFAMREVLLEKLIVLEFEEFKNDGSFINDGPVKKILNQHSTNIFYVDKNSIFSDSELHYYLENLSNKKSIKINRNEDNVNLNAFMIEIIELISILGPITKVDLIEIYKKVKGFEKFRFSLNKVDRPNNKVSNISIQNILDLMVHAGIINRRNKYYSLCKKEYRLINFMFSFSEHKFSLIRSALLSRVYKYNKGAMINDYNRSNK